MAPEEQQLELRYYENFILRYDKLAKLIDRILKNASGLLTFHPKILAAVDFLETRQLPLPLVSVVNTP
jgi:hypothetical protein